MTRTFSLAQNTSTPYMLNYCTLPPAQKVKISKINISKTREMAGVRSNNPSRATEASVTGGKRVTAMSILGVKIDERLPVTGHVDKILGSCASSMYALKVLRGRGMPTKLLHEVTRATMVRLLYASPSWFGFLKAADLHRLENLIRRAKRGNCLPEDGPSFASLSTLADNSLFQSIVSNPDHALRHLCQERPASQYNLRPRPHSFVLPNTDPKNFLPRLLYTKTPTNSFIYIYKLYIVGNLEFIHTSFIPVLFL